MAATPDFQANAEAMLKQYVYPELESTDPHMKARACWVYGEFAAYNFADGDWLRDSLNKIYQCLLGNDLPVRVNAAVALIKLLAQPVAVEFVRPGLQQIITIYLALIDEIDYDELINSLRTIVDTFENEIVPYALQLC